MNVWRSLPWLLCPALTACIGYGPSRGEGFPGYSETVVEPGVFLVLYNAPYDSDHRTLRRHLERRASELCPSGFDISELQYDGMGLLHSHRAQYEYVTAKVACR